MLFLLVLLSGTDKLWGANHYFEQISLSQGLSQSTVRAIYRDHVGLLWIGTKDGLNRYDGIQVRSYRVDKSTPNSLPDNVIYFITEDSQQNLWIGTAGILCRYDRKKDAFLPEKINGRAVSLRNALLKGQYLYSATSTKLYIYNTLTGEWTERAFSGDETDVKMSVKLEFSPDGRLLIASRWRGLFYCNEQTGKLTRVPFFKSENLLDIYRDTHNRLWISEFGRGVSCYDKNGKILHDLSKAPSLYRNDQVMDILEYKNAIWMVTDGNGVLVYSPENRTFNRIAHELDNPFSLQVNSLLSIYADKFSNLWLGTIRGGLIGVRDVHIQSYQSAPLNSSFGLSDQTVLSFYEDGTDNIWVGTDGGGINLYNPETRRFRHFASSYGRKVSGITRLNDNELLLSLYKEGLQIFDKRSKQMRPFHCVVDSKARILRNNWIGVAVQNGGNGNIYMADEKVYAYSIASGKVSELRITKPEEGPVRFHLSQFLPGKMIFFSNMSVRIMNLNTGIIRYSVVLNPDSTGEINVVEVDKNSRLWIGTTNGLYSIAPGERKLSRVKPDLIHSVSNFVLDINQSLWIGSGLDLFRYAIQSRELVHYRKSDGVIANEYLPKPHLRSRSGDVYLGGVSGFCRIDANIPLRKVEMPAFELLDIRLDGLLLPENRRSVDDELTTVRIPWNYSSLVVGVFMNTRALSNVKRVRYRIEGLNEHYSELDKPDLELQALSPGSYTLMLQTELKNDSWSEAVALLRIQVTPPWWQTWWFFMLVAGALSFALLRFRKLAVQKTRREMESQMQSRERELSEQKIRFLINISHELRTPLTLVYAPLRRFIHDEHTPAAIKPLLALMYKHVKNMKNMIDMVLDVRKMEMMEEKPRLVLHSVNQWMQEVADDFQIEFKARNIELITQPDTEAGIVPFDRNLCDKVLSNLLMNALKFSDPGTVVTVRSEYKSDAVRISVSDQGQGVSPADVPHLFTRFYQTRHEKGGTGIGLSYARTQIELHGGKIGYMAAQPKGSVFWFELPCKQHEILQQSTTTETFISQTDTSKAAIPDDNNRFAQLTLLLAEDEPDLLDYMYETLSPVFAKVLTARNGQEAIDSVLNHQPDLIVSDVMMPLMDGFELCRRVKTNLEVSHTPVILLTALGDDESSLTGYKMGADLYLAKPFGVDILLAILNNLFRTREELKKRYAGADTLVTTADLSFSPADEQFMLRLTSLLDLRLDDSDLRIDELASEMAMSRTSFYNKVKSVTGVSANVFVTDYKVKKACNLLRTTDLPVQEIAMQLGFVSQRYFSTVFKQTTAKTPTQYRNESNPAAKKD